MSEKGTCEKHGEFILSEGCPKCIADKKAFNGAISELETGQPSSVTETALALAPGADVEAMSYYDEAQKLLEYAEARVITTVEGVKLATDDLSIIAKLKKGMEAKKREYLDPLRAQAEAIRETYSSLMDPVFRADKITRDKILAYQAEQERIRAEQEEINRLKLEAAQKEKELKGEVTEPVELVTVQPPTRTTISTDMGTTGQRMIRKWEMEDMALVPEEYKVLDSARITKVVKAGIPSIPGIRIWEEPIIAVRAR